MTVGDEGAQIMADDREMARLKMGFPLICGAHDHDPYMEKVPLALNPEP